MNQKKAVIQEGEYPLVGNAFYIGECRVVMKKRKKEIDKKPEDYMIVVKPFFGYVSSMYLIEDDGECKKFSIDDKDKGLIYEVVVTKNMVSICEA